MLEHCRPVRREARRYLGLEALAKARLTLITDPEEEPATITALSA
jgi:hypothetical protein